MPVHPSRETYSHLNYSYAVHFLKTNSYIVSLNSAGHTTKHNTVYKKLLVLAKPKLVARLLASDFPSENPRTQTRNFPYTSTLAFIMTNY